MAWKGKSPTFVAGGSIPVLSAGSTVLSDGSCPLSRPDPVRTGLRWCPVRLSVCSCGPVRVRVPSCFFEQYDILRTSIPGTIIFCEKTSLCGCGHHTPRRSWAPDRYSAVDLVHSSACANRRREVLVGPLPGNDHACSSGASCLHLRP